MAFKKSLKLSSDNCNELLTWDPRDLEDKIVRHIKEGDSKGASTVELNMTLTAIKKFFVENRSENRINWKWLKGRIPRNKGKDRDYTKQELQQVLKLCDTRKSDPAIAHDRYPQGRYPVP